MDSEQNAAIDGGVRDVALPQELNQEQQELLRSLMDGSVTSDKQHVQDSVVDFHKCKLHLSTIEENTKKAIGVLQALRIEAAETRGAMEKCIRDVTRWEIGINPQATPPGVPAQRKTKKRGR